MTLYPGVGAAPLRVNFNATAYGGTPPYNYAWEFGDGVGASGAGVGNITHIYSLTGNYSVRLWVNDSVNATYSTGATVIVEATSVVVSKIYARPDPVDVNETLTLNATATGGTGSYRYFWGGLPGGCLSQNLSRLQCTPTATGNFSINMGAIDTDGFQNLSPILNLTIFGPLRVSATGVSLSELDVGQSTLLSVTPKGGSPPFTTSWIGLPPGCSSSNVTVLSCRPTMAGSYPLHAQVTDASGARVDSGSVDVVVYAALGAGPISPSPARSDVGQSLLLTGSPVGGSGRFVYAWTGGSAGCSTSTTATTTCIPTLAGNFTVTLEVTDPQTGANANSSATVLVAPTMFIELNASPSSLSMGSQLNLSTSITGGTAPYKLVYAGLPSGCSSTNSTHVSCSPSASGSFEVTVTVVDSAGAHLNATTNISVSGGGITTLELVAIGAVGLAVVALVAIAVVRRKRRTASTEEPSA